MISAHGLIRKISIGDMKNGLTYSVGQDMINGRAVITEIRMDVENSAFTRSYVYHILIQKNGSEVSRLWKTISGMPVAVEYDIEPEKNVEDQE
jgi:hypothetical protein